MSFPRYPKYKPSGVEWLGEVPEHWDVRSFRHCLCELFNGLTSTQVDETEVTVPVTRIETISTGTIDESRLGFINAEDARDDRKLRYGDILFSNINSLNMIGNCAIYTGGREIYAGMNLLVLRPASQSEPRWLYWLVRSPAFREVVESLAKPAINQASISQSSINSIAVPVPVDSEQTKIASFLDRETAKIDGLVGEQRRLIELLKEKRQAVISHAVTQGLNPHAPRKPSGIEWLGDVPEHWEVTPIGHLCDSISYGFTNPMPTTDEGPFLLTANDVDYGNVKYDTARRTSYEAFRNELTEKSRPKKDDVLITKDGTLGRVALHDGQEACINQSVASLRVKPNSMLPQFMATCLLGGIYQGQMIYDAGGTTIKHIYISRLAKMPIAYPSPSEQDEVLAFLREELATLDALTAEAERGIELLQERRTALISAAVTGQIDVRGLAETEAA